MHALRRGRTSTTKREGKMRRSGNVLLASTNGTGVCSMIARKTTACMCDQLVVPLPIDIFSRSKPRGTVPLESGEKSSSWRRFHDDYRQLWHSRLMKMN
jgi:hypothetical protein